MEAELMTLKLKYQTALSLYQSRIAAISEIELRGEVPSDDVRAEVVTALEALERACRQYREALFQTAFPTDEIPPSWRFFNGFANDQQQRFCPGRRRSSARAV